MLLLPLNWYGLSIWSEGNSQSRKLWHVSSTQLPNTVFSYSRPPQGGRHQEQTHPKQWSQAMNLTSGLQALGLPMSLLKTCSILDLHSAVLCSVEKVFFLPRFYSPADDQRTTMTLQMLRFIYNCENRECCLETHWVNSKVTLAPGRLSCYQKPILLMSSEPESPLEDAISKSIKLEGVASDELREHTSILFINTGKNHVT